MITKNSKTLTQSGPETRGVDNRAIELVLQGVDVSNELTRKIGILIGLCSILFFKATVKSDNYPDMDDRIDAIMAKVNPDPQHGMWDVAVLAYKLWDRLHSIGLVWREGLESPKAQYQDIKRQVKEREINV